MTKYLCYNCQTTFEEDGGQLAAGCPECGAGYPMLGVLS